MNSEHLVIFGEEGAEKEEKWRGEERGQTWVEFIRG